VVVARGRTLRVWGAPSYIPVIARFPRRGSRGREAGLASLSPQSILYHKLLVPLAIVTLQSACCSF
jgi:hypothetical protein